MQVYCVSLLFYVYIYIYRCRYIISTYTYNYAYSIVLCKRVYIIVIAVFVYLFSFVHIHAHIYIYSLWFICMRKESENVTEWERDREGSLLEVIAAFASQVQDVLKEKRFVRARRHLHRWPASRWHGLPITISGMDGVGCKITRIFTIHSWWAGWLGAWPKFDSFHWAGLFKGDSRGILVRSGFVCCFRNQLTVDISCPMP